jgi:ribosomal protein S12 methylthiotransferase RimO
LHIVPLGCARNDVDSEELAARFADSGFTLVSQPEDAEVVVVNTCGFIDAAKQESIDEIMAASELKEQGKVKTVIATGCLAERYGSQLADSLPEADAVVGFEGYSDIANTVRALLAGGHVDAHVPQDRRLIPLTPIESHTRTSPHVLTPHITEQTLRVSPVGTDHIPLPTPPWLPTRTRLSDSPTAPLKIATGCDRRCAFCAIPAFRGGLVSRPPEEIIVEAKWLADQGVRELFLVSENTTSYGKDRGDLDALPRLLACLSEVDVDWVRLSYLQPAEVKPSLIDAIASTPKVVPYFDLPFQHASKTVLKRMRRFGDYDSFLTLLDRIRMAIPNVGVRTNVIVGFPGEKESDVATLLDFLGEARLDAVGVFAYSDEEGTEGATLDGHLDEEEIAARTSEVSQWADTVTALQAESRIGQDVEILIDGVDEDDTLGRQGASISLVGHAAQQGPEDGRTFLRGTPDQRGHIVKAPIVSTEGVDWFL